MVCHTTTTYHRNAGIGDSGHFAGQDCMPCHSHDNEFSHVGVPGASCMETDCHGYPSHPTHLDSEGTGPGIPLTADGCYICHAAQVLPLRTASLWKPPRSATSATTQAGPTQNLMDLDNTAIGAKANWNAGDLSPGIYESDGLTLRSGKEKWCATCHDNEPAYSQAVVVTPSEVVVDNSDPTGFELIPLSPDPDYWRCKAGAGAYGADLMYCYNSAGTGTATATWTLDITNAGDYAVYAWWKAGASRASDAPYTIYYDGGSETVGCGPEDRW